MSKKNKKREYYDISGVVLDTSGKKIGTMDVPTVAEREQRQNLLQKQKSNTTQKDTFSQVGDNLHYLGKAGKTGVASGLATIPLSTLQETEESLEKGKKINNAADVLSTVGDSLKAVNDIQHPDILGNAKEFIGKAAKIVTQKGKDNVSKGAELLKEGVSTAAKNTGATPPKADVGLALVGAANPDIAKTTKKARKSIDKFVDKQQEELAEEGQDKSALMKTVASGINVAGNMTPSLVASAVTKNPNIGRIAMANMVKGQTAEQALKEGKTLEEANELGNLSALAETGTEAMTGGVDLLGKGALDDVAGNVVNKYVKNPVANFAIRKAGGIMGENLEESASNVLDKALARGSGDTNAKITGEDIVGPWGPTTVSSLLINSLGGSYTPKAYRQYLAENKIANLNDVEREKLTQVTQKVKTGQPLNDEDVAVINVINNKEVTQEDIANQRVQQLQQAVESGNLTDEQLQQANDEINAINEQIKQTQRIPTQENLENNQNMVYNEDTNEKGSVENDFRQLQEASRGLSKEQHESLYSGDKSGIKGIRENISRVLQPRMENIIRSNNDNGKSLKNGFTEVNNTDFEEIFKVNHPYLRNPDTVTPYDAGEYKNNKNYLSEDGLSGFSITPSGDLISVFNNSGKPGMLLRIKDTVQSEAKTLDCFSSKAQDLPSLYQDAFGFKTAAIMDFNYDIMAGERGKEYADAFVEKYGEAPVYFMVKTDKNVTPKHFNKDQYSEAMGYRDSFVENEGTSDSSFSNENISANKEEELTLKIDEKGNSKMSDEKPQILEEVPREKRKINISNVIDTAMQRLVNKGHNIDKVAKANNANRIKTSYDRTLAVGQEAQKNIGDNQTNLRGKVYKNFEIKNPKTGKIEKTTSSVNGIYEDAERSGIPSKVLDEYAVNKLNIDRRKSGNEKWIEQFPNMDVEYSEKIINDIEALYDDIQRVHGNLTQYYANLRQNMVDSGILSKDSKDYYDMNTPNYVRIQRNVGKSGSPSSKQTVKGVEINDQQQGIKGGNYDILPLRETAAQYTIDTLASMRKNIVGQELGKLIPSNEQLENATIDFEEENFNPEIAKVLKNGEYQLTYFENGVAKTIPIDSGLYYAMTNPQISQGLKDIETLNQEYGAGLLSRMQRGLLTDKNIYFLFTNFFKDIGDAPINSKHSAKFVKNYPSMVADLSRGGAYSTLWKNLGGEASSYFKDGRFVGETNPKNVVTKAIDKTSKAVNKALTPIEVANNFIEQLPRLTEFKSTIEANGYEVNADGDLVPQKGKNPTKSVDEVLDEAMYNSAEITTNFKRGGTWTKTANSNGATFLNASVQGFDKFIRNFTDVIDTTTGKPKINSKAAVKLMLKATIFGITPSMINDLMNGDDDDYKDIPEYQKDSYYLFKLGDHNWLRIPKGRMASVFGDAARRTRNAMKGDDKAFDGFLQQVENQIAPNSVFSDNVLSGFKAVKDNKAWSGNPIVSTWEENEDFPEDEYDAKTDEFSKWLGKKLHKSPKKINYLLDQYSGVIGDIALPLATKYTNTSTDNKAAQIFLSPMANKFSTNDIISNKSQSEFYDAYNKAQNTTKHNKKNNIKNPEDEAVNKYLYNQNKEMADLKSKITEVQESDMSNKEKMAQVKEYQDQINKLAKKSVKESKNVEKIGNNEIKIGDAHFAIANGETKKIKQETIDKAKDYGLSVGDYTDIMTFKSNTRADKDSEGKSIRGSAKQKVVDYVYSKEELTEAQKIEIIKKLYSRN